MALILSSCANVKPISAPATVQDCKYYADRKASRLVNMNSEVPIGANFNTLDTIFAQQEAERLRDRILAECIANLPG